MAVAALLVPVCGDLTFDVAVDLAPLLVLATVERGKLDDLEVVDFGTVGFVVAVVTLMAEGLDADLERLEDRGVLVDSAAPSVPSLERRVREEDARFGDFVVVGVLLLESKETGL